MHFREKSVMFFATGCMIGYIPYAPGTFGSILGLSFCFLLSKTDLFFAIGLNAIFIVLAVWIAGKAEHIIKENDPGCVVIDEISGMMLTLMGLSFNFISVVAGLLVFRILDILKPFPIRFLEKKFTGGIGIVIDDVAAGICANLIIRAVFLITNTN